jgi:hypothetical protein
LSVSLSGELNDYVMGSVDLDLELKHGAAADIEFFLGGASVGTDFFDPAGPNDDGPDSSDGDNYRYTYGPILDDLGNPTVVFDTVAITATTGEISLEGGADGTENGTLNPTSNASQFGIYREYDGQFTCGDAATAFEAGVEGTFTLVSIGGDETPELCGYKYYDIEADAANSQFLFAPADASGATGTAVFSGVLSANDQPLTVDPITGVQIILLEYDPTGGTNFQPMFACEQPPADASFSNLDAMLPAGESYCFFDVMLDTEYDAAGDLVGDETWYVVGYDDPNFSFK